MIIKEIDFIGSFPSETKCPKGQLPEYAFIGRSNVGKSSLINMLCQRKEVARVSKTPGKTQLLNFFLINRSWFLVDLPGYGYAKISKSQRKKWQQMIERYLSQRQNLQCAFVLLDSRHRLQTIDQEFINWMGLARVPFVIVYTKTDKLTKTQKIENIELIQKDLLEHWNELPQQFITSSEKHIGREEVMQFIEGLNQKKKADLE